MSHTFRAAARLFTAIHIAQILLSALPVQAQVSGAVGAPSGRKPLIDAAANGVPLVLIAPPGPSGISRNQYNQFNVGPQGLILNNATGNVQTQLGGWVKGNLQLGATPARIILNEVTGASASQLRGAIEVAGQRADVVVANPNGISCDGCGFLNTSRATLSTGVPLFSGNGALTGFDVRQGVLSIGAGGLSAMEQQQLDLHARGLVVEGEVWTQHLQAIIGVNQVQHGAPGHAPEFNPHAPDTATGDTPRFAVDLKALGGMYAGSIYLIATDKGLGVKSTGRLATLAGNLVLSANGDLTLKDSYSAGETRITAQGQASLTGQNQAEGNLSVQGQGVHTAGASVLAQRLDIDAGTGVLHNQAGKLQATSSGADALRISATGLYNNAGAIQANGAVVLDARGSDLNNAGGLLTGAAVTLAHAKQVYNQAGTIHAAADLSLATGALDTTAGSIDAGGKLSLQTGQLKAAGAKVTANGDIAVTASTTAELGSSTWSAGQNLAISSAASLNAAGASLLAQDSLSLHGAGISTAGADLSARHLALNAGAGELNNAAGKMQATETLSARAQGIANTGGTLAANGAVAVNAGSGELHNQVGLIYSAQGQAGITVQGALHNTGGVIAAATALTVEGGPLNNTEGVISGGNSAAISVLGLVNEAGLIESGSGGLTIDTRGQTLSNAASGSARGIVSTGDIRITAGDVHNTSVSGTGGAGYIGAGAALTVTATGSITNTAGATITAAAASMDAGADVTNAGLVTAGNTTIHAAGEVTNAGLINATDGATTITASDVRNTGRIYGDSVAITGPTFNSAGADAAAGADGAGAVIASRSGDITIEGPVSNTAGGLILSLNDLTVSGAVTNSGATLSASRQLTISGALSNTNAGLSLTTLTWHDASGGFYIQPAGSTATYRPEELLYVARDSGFWVLPSPVYPLAQFGGTAKPLMSDCAAPTEAGIVCGNFYSATDPIWQLMGVAGPGPGPGQPPAGCFTDLGEGGIAPITTGGCGSYWSGVEAWNASLPAHHAALDAAINAFNHDLAARTVNNWYELSVTGSTVTETAVTASKPGQVLAGGNIALAGGANQDSIIVAGGNLTGGALQNLATAGQRETTQQGTMVYSWGDHDGGAFGSGYRRNRSEPQPIATAPTVQSFDLPLLKYLAGTPPGSVAAPVALPAAPAPSPRTATVPATGAGVPAAPHPTGPAPLPVKAEGFLTVSAQGAVRVPGSQLFALNQAPGARYLVETDPAFTGYRNWLSSDYFLGQLAIDPERSFKRYGDGFAEQRLVDEQILALTGRRFLSGYSSTEAEYQALLDAGVQFARQYQLSPGVSLSAEQMASLTTDIVWLEIKAVALPDGTTVQALVPTVYLRRPVEGELSPAGALVAGANVTLRSAGDLVNSGTIAATGDAAATTGRLVIEARIITSSGTLAGNAIMATATETLNNAGGVIQGLGPASSASLNARDIILRTTTQTSSRQVIGPEGTHAGTSAGTTTNTDRIATITADSVTLAALNNIELKGARVRARGDLTATAGGSITSDAVQTGYTLQVPQDASSHGNNSQSRSGHYEVQATTQQITTLQAGGNLSLTAAGDASFRGTNADAGGDLTVQARSITIEAAKEKLAIDQQGIRKDGYERFAQSDETLAGGVFTAGNNAALSATGDKAQGQGNIAITGAILAARDGEASLKATNNVVVQNATTIHTREQESYRSSKGFLSSSTTAQSASSQASQAKVSAIVGDTVLVRAGDDVVVQASEVHAAGALQITAGRDVSITAAQQTSNETSSFERKQSGFSASVGQISWGKSAQSGAQAVQTTSQAGSTVSGANVNIRAGRDATVAASAVLADQDIAISAGRNIALDAAANTETTQSRQESSSTAIGLTPGITGRFTAFSKTSGSETGDTTSTTQSTSLLSANNGNLTLTAGADAQYRGTGEGNVTAQGATLLAKGAVRATGNAVDLGAAQDSSTSHSHQESKSLAIGSQLTGAVGGAITRIGDMVQEAGETDNSRLKGALALKSGYDAYKLLNNAQVSITAADATSPLAASGSGIGVSVSISSSKSSQDTSQSHTTNRGTSVQAQTIEIQSRDGDINTAGAKLQGTDISLDSAAKLNLGAVQNTATLESSNKSSSSGIGATLAFGGQQNGLSLQASAGKTNGQSSGRETTHDNTQVTAAGTLTLKSAGDANLQGAQLAGNSVKAEIGGNLNLATLQDQSEYQSKQTTSGWGISLCIPPICGGVPVTGGVSQGKQQIEHSYQSATGQSGIAAGQGGYEITVKGNTDLKGAAITSQAPKDDNTLTTGSLTYSDLNNSQTTSASSSNTSLGYSGGGVGAVLGNAVTSNLMGNLQGKAGQPETGTQNAITQSVISPGNITITGKDEQGVQAAATLTSRDAATANQALLNTLTLQQAQELAAKQKELQDNQRAAELIGAVVTHVIGDMAAHYQWKDGSPEKLALHGMAGLIQAKVGGGNVLAGVLGGMSQEALAPVLAEYLEANGIQRYLPDGTNNPDYAALMQAGATLAGAAVGAVARGNSGAATGASVALTGVTNNFLSHAESSKRLQLKGELLACKDQTCREEKQAGISELDRLDAWRDQQIEQACISPASVACQGWTAAIQTAATSYHGQYGALVDTAERASVQNQAFKYQQAADNPFLHGIGTGLLKLTPPGLAVGAVGGIASAVQSIADKGLTQTLIDSANAIAGLPEDLRNRLNSTDPTIRGEALVDLVALGTGASVLTAGGTRLALDAAQKAQVTKVIAATDVPAIKPNPVVGDGDLPNVYASQVGGKPAVVSSADMAANAQATLNVHKVTAPVDFAHVIGADYNARRGTVTGGHSTLNGDVKIVEIVNGPDAKGVYEARVQMKDARGNWIDKRGNQGVNTMFPSSWTSERIKVEIDGAWKSTTKRIDPDGKWNGTSPSGVRIEGWTGNRVTAYPIYGAD